jgi:hypothetical protein
LVDVGVDRQMTFFDETRQASIARFVLIDRSHAPRLTQTSSRRHFWDPHDPSTCPIAIALIQCCQRLTYELRLSTLVILSRPAPPPAAGDTAVARPTTTLFNGLFRAPEPIGDMPPRHIPRPTSLRAFDCVLSALVVCGCLPEPCPAATGGSGVTIETGSESAIGIKPGCFLSGLKPDIPHRRSVIGRVELVGGKGEQHHGDRERGEDRQLG